MMTARVSMLLKSRASLTCFRACFLPGRAKDLSAPGTLQLTRRKQRLNVIQIYTSHESWPGKECIILSKYFALSIALITLFHVVDRLVL